MRLFIYNNNRLKYVRVKAYNQENTLFDVFGNDIEKNLINGDAQKEVLWATAFRTLQSIDFKGSKPDFAKEDGYNRTIGAPDNPNPNGQNGYDFFIDRGNGWCALAKNYNVYNEISSDGKISNKKEYLTESKVFPWQDYTNSYWGITTSGATEFAQKLVTGQTSIIPFGVGSFYGSDQAMTKDNFQNMIRVATTLANTVRAVVLVEWPAVVYDSSFFSIVTKAGNIEKDQIQTALVSYKAFMKNISGTEPDNFATPEPSHLGANRYLIKLRELENYLSVAFRQVRMLTTSYHFDTSKLDMTWYQTLYTGVLYTLSLICKVAASIVGGISASGVAGLAISDGKANYALGTPAKELFSLMGSYVEKKNTLYQMGGNPKGINQAVEDMLDTLLIAYAAYELFLLKWGIGQLVTNRTPEQLIAKLEKVKRLIRAKNSNEGLPVINKLKEEVDVFVKAE